MLVVLFIPLARLAKQKAAIPRLWESLLLFSWAIIWLGISYIRKAFQIQFSEYQYEANLLVLLGFSLSLLVYAILWILIKRKPDLSKYEHKLDQIGKKE